MSVNRNGKYKERTREGSITAIASALSKNLVSGGLGVKLTRSNYYDLAFLNNEQNGDVLNRLGFGLEATKTALAHRVQMYTHPELGRINLPEDVSQIFESRAFIRTGFEFGATEDWGRAYLTFDHNLDYDAKIAPSVSLQYYNSQVNNSFRTKLTEFTSRQKVRGSDVFQPSPLETRMAEYKRLNPGVGRKEGSSTLYSLKDLLENSGDEDRQDLIMLNNELSFSEYKVLAQGDEGVIEKPLSVDNIVISERYNNNGQPYYFLDVDKDTVLSVNSIRKMMSRVAQEASTPEARRKHFDSLYTRKKSDNPGSNLEARLTYNNGIDFYSLLYDITATKNGSGQKLNHSLGLVLEEQLSLTTEKLEDLKNDSENLLNDFVETTLDKDYYISKKDEYYKRHGIQNFRNIWKTMIENGSYIPYPMFVPGYNRNPNAVNHLDSLNGTNTEFSYDYLVKNKSKHPLAAALVEQQANYYTERQLNPLSLNAAKTRAFKELLDDSNFHPSRGKTMSKASSLVLYYNETDDSYAVQVFKHPSANQADKIILGGTSNFNGHSITIDDTNKTKLGTTPTYIVTEGVATAVATAAAFDKTSVVQNGLGVVSAGSALNIKKVVQKIYDTVPNANIIVFADNDFENAHNRILHHLRGELLGAIEPKDVSRSATMADYISTDAGYKTTIEVSKWVSETEKNTGVRPRVAVVTTPFFNKETGKIIKGELKHELYDALTKPIHVEEDSPQQVKDAAARQRQVIASFYPVSESEDGKDIDMGKSILSGYSLKLDNDDLAANVFKGVQSIITENENNAKKQIEEIRNNSTDANPKLASKIHAETRAFTGKLRQGAFDVFANRIVSMTNTALKHLDVGNHQYAKASLEADTKKLGHTTVPKTLITRTRNLQNRLAREKSLEEQLSGDALKALTSGLKDEQLQKSADKFLLAHGLYTTTVQTSDGSTSSVAKEIPRFIGNSEYGKIPTLTYLTARLLNNYTTVPETSKLFGKLSGGVVSVVMDAIKDKELKEILGADPKDKMPVWSTILQMSEAIHNSAEVVPATPNVKTYMGSARAFESAFIGMAYPDSSDQSVNYVKAYRQLNDKTATGLMMSFGKAEIKDQDSTIYNQLTLVDQEQENELLLRRLAVTNMVVEMANEIQAMGSNPDQVRGFYSHIADAIRKSDVMLAEQLDYQKELSSLNLSVKQDVVEKYYQDISDKLVTKLNYSRIDTEDMDLNKLGSGFKAVSSFYAEGVTYKQNVVANMLKNLYPESYVDSLQPYEKKVFEISKENLLLLADRDIAGERKNAKKDQSKEKEQEMVAGVSAVDAPNVDKPQKESPQKSNESLSPGM